MDKFTDAVAGIIEETFRQYPSVSLADGLESISFCLGNLFTDNQRTDAAIANALVDACLARDEDDARALMLRMLTEQRLLDTCEDASRLMAKIGIRNGKPIQEPMITNSFTPAPCQDEDGCDSLHEKIIESMVFFHSRKFDELLFSEYVSDDARQAICYMLNLTKMLNRDLMPKMFYQFVMGMMEEDKVS